MSDQIPQQVSSWRDWLTKTVLASLFTTVVIPLSAWMITQRSACLVKAEAVIDVLLLDADEYFSRDYIFRQAVPVSNDSVTQTQFAEAQQIVLGHHGYSDERFRNRSLISMYHSVSRAWEQVDFSGLNKEDLAGIPDAELNNITSVTNYVQDYRPYVGTFVAGQIPPPGDRALPLWFYKEVAARSEFAANCGYLQSIYQSVIGSWRLVTARVRRSSSPPS